MTPPASRPKFVLALVTLAVASSIPTMNRANGSPVPGTSSPAALQLQDKNYAGDIRIDQESGSVIQARVVAE